MKWAGTVKIHVKQSSGLRIYAAGINLPLIAQNVRTCLAFSGILELEASPEAS